jgi:hypothetical protein
VNGIRLLTLFTALALTACVGTGTKGVVPIGPDLYMIGGLGRFTDYSSSAVKARFFQDAAKFCASKNQVMRPVNSVGQDSGIGTYASAEVQFTCVTPTAAE